MRRKNEILKEKEFEKFKKLIEKNGLDRIGLQIFWDKDNQNIGLFQLTTHGLSKILESQKLRKKPSWLKLQIETCNEKKMIYCTASQDEKKLSLPHHTRQLSRKKQLGDTNSATAYRSNTKRMRGTDRRGRKENKGKKNNSQRD